MVNEYEESQLRDVLYNYGELKQAPAMARTIVSARKNEPISTSKHLQEVLKRF